MASPPVIAQQTDDSELDSRPLTYEAMFGPFDNAEARRLQHNEDNSCNNCGDSYFPNFHFFDPTDTDENHIDCIFCRAYTDTILHFEEKQTIDFVAIEGNLSKGVLPENVSELRSMLMKTLGRWYGRWRKTFEDNTKFKIPADFRASYDKWAVDWMKDRLYGDMASEGEPKTPSTEAQKKPKAESLHAEAEQSGTNHRMPLRPRSLKRPKARSSRRLSGSNPLSKSTRLPERKRSLPEHVSISSDSDIPIRKSRRTSLKKPREVSIELGVSPPLDAITTTMSSESGSGGKKRTKTTAKDLQKQTAITTSSPEPIRHHDDKDDTVNSPQTIHSGAPKQANSSQPHWQQSTNNFTPLNVPCATMGSQLPLPPYHPPFAFGQANLSFSAHTAAHNLGFPHTPLHATSTDPAALRATTSSFAPTQTPPHFSGHSTSYDRTSQSSTQPTATSFHQQSTPNTANTASQLSQHPIAATGNPTDPTKLMTDLHTLTARLETLITAYGEDEVAKLLDIKVGRLRQSSKTVSVAVGRLIEGLGAFAEVVEE